MEIIGEGKSTDINCVGAGETLGRYCDRLVGESSQKKNGKCVYRILVSKTTIPDVTEYLDA